MSKQLQSIAVSPLDARIVKGLIEKMSVAKINSDKAGEVLVQAVADYKEYMERLGGQAGIDSGDVPSYRVNVATNQLEPIPVPAAPPSPVKAPDAGDAPAPFRDAEVAIEPGK